MKFIAEFCQNHNGDFEILKDMIHEAHEAGADYAKIQTIFADMLSYRDRFENGLTKNGIIKSIKRPYQEEYDRLKNLEISYELQSEFVDICKKVGIKPLTTAFTLDSSWACLIKATASSLARSKSGLIWPPGKIKAS